MSITECLQTTEHDGTVVVSCMTACPQVQEAMGHQSQCIHKKQVLASHIQKSNGMVNFSVTQQIV